ADREEPRGAAARTNERRPGAAEHQAFASVATLDADAHVVQRAACRHLYEPPQDAWPAAARVVASVLDPAYHRDVCGHDTHDFLCAFRDAFGNNWDGRSAGTVVAVVDAHDEATRADRFRPCGLQLDHARVSESDRRIAFSV